MTILSIRVIMVKVTKEEGTVMIDTIIFDVDDTLYDQALSFKNTVKKKFQTTLSEAELDRMYIISRKTSDALFDQSEAGEISILEMHIRRVTSACEAFDIPITRQKAIEFQAAYVEEQKKIRLFDEVRDLLDHLKQENKQLGVLTNGEKNHQAMKIEQLNLKNWIPEENIFISGAIGHAKPKREVFDIIEAKLNLDKSTTVYIGDSFDNDIVGAKNAGWQALWMNHRKRELPESSVKPDVEVHSAKELLHVLRRKQLLV